MTPKRIQRRRTKGWHMPENTVYVGRPSRYGNPYPIGTWVRLDGGVLPVHIDTAEKALALFITHIMHPTIGAEARGLVRAELRGKDLACWCPVGKPCHADVLLELANA